MRDSRASLRQNNISLSQNETIQRLTYLTIAYLPIALMAVSLYPLLGAYRAYTDFFSQYFPSPLSNELSSQSWV